MSLDLHVRAIGEGAPLLLLHGFTGSGEAWGAGLLHGLSRRRRVLAVDLPGHGRSPRPPDHYSVERLAVDLARLLDREGVERAAWVGYSMGGRMALAAAVLTPERVERLVLEGASPGLADPRERTARRRADGELAERILEIGMERFVDEWMALPLFDTRKRLPGEALEQARAHRLRNRPDGLARALRTLGTGAQPSFWGRLAEVKAPALVLVGEEDGKFLEVGRKMARGLPRSRMEIVPGAGHTVHVERPELWLGAVLGFLSEGDPGG